VGSKLFGVEFLGGGGASPDTTSEGSERANRDPRKGRGMSSGYFVLAFVVLAIVLIVLVIAYRKLPRD
jgi:hypothetical protein